MPFIPLDDTAPRLRIPGPWVNWGLIFVCIVTYWIQIAVGQEGGLRLIYALGVVPSTVFGHAVLDPSTYIVEPWVTLVTYQFLHGGLGHLAGNVLYLWVFGDNIEDAMGHIRYLIFFLLCGVLAALSQVLAAPYSDVPLVGASGAISGVLGAYLVLHPKAKVLIPILFVPVYLPAWLLLVFWIGFQVFSFSAESNLEGGGTAWLAHIGGFIAGSILVFAFRHRDVALFGTKDLPSGITLRDKARWERHAARRGKGWRGPWSGA